MRPSSTPAHPCFLVSAHRSIDQSPYPPSAGQNVVACTQDPILHHCLDGDLLLGLLGHRASRTPRLPHDASRHGSSCRILHCRWQVSRWTTQARHPEPRNLPVHRFPVLRSKQHGIKRNILHVVECGRVLRRRVPAWHVRLQISLEEQRILLRLDLRSRCEHVCMYELCRLLRDLYSRVENACEPLSYLR